MAEKPEDFMNYIMQSGLMVRNHFIVEIDDLMIFSHEQSSITWQVVASILYTELAWFNGYPYTFPVIAPPLERKAPYPEGTPLPECPKESRSRRAVGLKENCQVWWHYLLVLLQSGRMPIPCLPTEDHSDTIATYWCMCTTVSNAYCAWGKLSYSITLLKVRCPGHHTCEQSTCPPKSWDRGKPKPL